MSYGCASYGSLPYAGMSSYEETIVGIDLVLTIGGVDVTGKLQPGSLNYSSEIGLRSNLSFTLWDQTYTLHPEPGQRVALYYRRALIFGGMIDSSEESAAGGWGEHHEISVDCVDYSILCANHMVIGIYRTDGQTLYDVVSAIVNTDSGDAGERLSDDGVSLAGVDNPGPTLSPMTYYYETPADAFDRIAELTGLVWWMGNDRVLHFHDPARDLAPHPLDDTVWASYRGLQVTRENSDYRNIQILRAGVGSTLAREEFFKGDGEQKTFDLVYPVSDAPFDYAASTRTKPVLFVDVGAGYVEVSAADVQLRKNETDQPTIEWFYEPGSPKISQNIDASFPALGSTHKLKVVYSGEYPLREEARDDGEIAARADPSFEDGSGVHVQVTEASEVNDSSLARDWAIGLLRRYGRSGITISFQTDEAGFRAGQLLEVDQGEFGISGDFLIRSVSAQLISDSFLRYNIEAVYGEDFGSWADFYRRIARKERKTYEDNESVDLIRSRSAQVVIGETISLSDPLELWDDAEAWPHHCVIGLSKIGGRRKTTPEGEIYTGALYGPLVGLPYIL